jgi:hypothetical protein
MISASSAESSPTAATYAQITLQTRTAMTARPSIQVAVRAPCRYSAASVPAMHAYDNP